MTVPGSPSAPALRREAERGAVLLLGVALVYGCVEQGGFAAADGAVVGTLVVLAGLLRLVGGQLRWGCGPALAAGALVLLAAWTAARAAATAGPAGLWAGVPAAVLAVAAGTVAVLTPPARRILHGVVVACGLLVAGTGWVGTAWHAEPLALLSSGLWRASSTLTYANATAAFLVTTILAVAASGHRDHRGARVVLALLLVGLVAALSRAGLLTAALGLLVLLASPPHRRRLAGLGSVLPAAAVATAGLLPGLAEGSSPHPVLATGTLVAGLAVAALPPRRGAAAGVLVLGVLVLGTLVLVPPTPAAGPPLAGVGAALDGVVSTRLTADSAERDDLRRVTAEQLLSAPVGGVGPGRLDLVYVDHAGRLVSAQFTHDEFLQTAAETGLVGAALAVGAFAALAGSALRRRCAPALAVVAAFAAHSTADFLWHIPVLPLLAVLVVVPLLGADPTRPPVPRPPDRPSSVRPSSVQEGILS